MGRGSGFSFRRSRESLRGKGKYSDAGRLRGGSDQSRVRGPVGGRPRCPAPAPSRGAVAAAATNPVLARVQVPGYRVAPETHVEHLVS